MVVGDIISGFKTDDTVTLHRIDTIGDGIVSMEVVQYEVDSDQYDWALTKLAEIQS